MHILRQPFNNFLLQIIPTLVPRYDAIVHVTLEGYRKCRDSNI